MKIYQLIWLTPYYSPRGNCYASRCMELSLEAYRNIVKNVGNRADIASLCRVSKNFQRVAERSLYNTLYMRNPRQTISLCDMLATKPRLAALVDALTIYMSGSESSDSGEDDDEEDDAEDNSEQPEIYWTSIARALEQTKNLRHLNIHIQNGFDSSAAWIFNKCVFRLRSLHCDLDWDINLISFLNKQDDLDDLYVMDFNELDADTPTEKKPIQSTQLNTLALSRLSKLECTFSEAAAAIVPDRPITHLKTCFSRSEIKEKRAEMSFLMSKINQSTRPLRALDIADSSYSEEFSEELLRAIVNSKATTSDIRYLGTFVLPIAGRERLRFYGLLMRLPLIQCIEVDVSDWVPQPASSPAFRALANELRLYNPSVNRVIFVHEFDRTVVSAVDGLCRVDPYTSADTLWREV